MKRTTFLHLVTIALLLLCSLDFKLFAQADKPMRVGCIAFYNMENLFDTIDDPNTKDDEFTPAGENKWNSQKYYIKLANMAKVISQIGTELVQGGPSVLGMCEVENKTVLEDLIKTEPLNKISYGIVHYDSPYNRGVDCAFLYRKDVFNVTYSRAIPFIKPDDPNFKTRDFLLVGGMFDGEQMYFIINHWPSRRGGEKKSAPLRNLAGKQVRKICDSLLAIDPNAKIFVMGDLNDDPTNESVLNELAAKGNEKNLKQGELFNPMFKLYKEGIGSLAHQDKWNLFDQIIISQALLGDDRSSYKFVKAKIFNKPFLQQQEGSFKGYPLRTYVGTNFTGGYSDHFPSYVFIAKEKK